MITIDLFFAFENNHYSEHTGVSYAVGSEDIAGRAESFGMKAWRVDGCDFFKVYETMGEVVDHARAGKGPAAVEFDTERFFGHFEGDPQNYRGEGEIARIRKERDCITIFREHAAKKKLVSKKVHDADRLLISYRSVGLSERGNTVAMPVVELIVKTLCIRLWQMLSCLSLG